MGQALYQPPPLDPHRLVVAFDRLQRRQRIFWLLTSAALAAGSALSFAAPALFAGLVASSSVYMASPPMSWKLAFLYACFTLIPLLYWLEWRTAGQFYMNQLRSQSAGPDGRFDWQSIWRDPWRRRASAAELATWIEIFLFAPRLTLSSIERFRSAARLGRPDLHHAARLLVQLSRHDRGVPVADLLRTDPNPDDFWPTAAYLRFHDWIDIATDRQSIWLLTDARKRLG